MLRVSWTARRSNKSILKEINPEYSLKALILKLKFQYFGYLMRRADSLGKTLMLAKTEGRKRRGKSTNRGRFYFLELQNQCGWDLQPQN